MRILRRPLRHPRRKQAPPPPYLQRQTADPNACPKAVRVRRTARLFRPQELYWSVALPANITSWYTYNNKLTPVGFVRYGNRRRQWGLACVISSGKASNKRMYVGRKHAREQWTDILDWHPAIIAIDDRGYAVFPVNAMSVSVWVNVAAEGRGRLGRPLYVAGFCA